MDFYNLLTNTFHPVHNECTGDFNTQQSIEWWNASSWWTYVDIYCKVL